MRRWVLCTVLLGLGAALLAQADEPVILRLPTNGHEVRTPVLEAFREFRVIIRAPFDLRVLWREGGGPSAYALLFDGHAVTDRTRITEWDYHKDMNALSFAFTGTGDPLVIRLAKDLSATIRHAQVEIVRVPNPAHSSPTVLAAKTSQPAVAPREGTTGDSVLERAVFSLPTDASAMKTALPMQLHRSYDITLRAPHNLGLLCGTPQYDQFALQLDTWLRSVQTIPACQERRDVEEIVVTYIGRGVPLLLQLAKNVSDVLPQVTVEITPTPPPAPASRLPAVLVWGIGGLGIVMCWRLYAARRRARRREAPPREAPVIARLALPSGNAELEKAREQLARARQQAQDALREAAYARQQTAEFRREQDEVSRRAAGLAHWAALERNFLDPEYQQRFAAKHLAQVLGAYKQPWFEEAKAVHDDPALRSVLERDYPDVLAVLNARLEVVRIAERLEVEPARTPTYTPEERQRRVTNFRNRLLNWRQTKAEDFIAQHVQQLEMLREFEDELAKYDLDEDERERLLQEFRQELDVIEPPKPKGRKPADEDEEDNDAGFISIRPDR